RLARASPDAALSPEPAGCGGDCGVFEIALAGGEVGSLTTVCSTCSLVAVWPHDADHSALPQNLGNCLVCRHSTGDADWGRQVGNRRKPRRPITPGAPQLCALACAAVVLRLRTGRVVSAETSLALVASGVSRAAWRALSRVCVSCWNSSLVG